MITGAPTRKGPVLLYFGERGLHAATMAAKTLPVLTYTMEQGAYTVEH